MKKNIQKILIILISFAGFQSAQAVVLTPKLKFTPDENSYYSKFTVTGQVLADNYELCTLVPTIIQTQNDVPVTVKADCENAPTKVEITAIRKKSDNSRSKSDWLRVNVWLDGSLRILNAKSESIGSVNNLLFYSKTIY